MIVEGNNRPYLDVAREVRAAALAYIVDNPKWYAESVVEGLIDFFSPPLRLIPSELNVVRQRWPRLWRALSIGEALLALAGLATLFMRVPPAVKLGPVIFLVSAVGTSLLAHTENRRFAAPIVPLVLMSGVAGAVHLSRRVSANPTRQLSPGICGDP